MCQRVRSTDGPGNISSPNHKTISSLGPRAERSQRFRYGLALAVTAVAVWAAKSMARDGHPAFYLPLTAAILFSAWYGGVGPALLSQVCGALFAFSFLARPSPFSPVTSSELYGLLLFLGIGKLTLFLTANVKWNRDLRRSEHSLKLIAAATNDCIWEWDVKSGKVARSGNLAGVFGYPARLIRDDVEWWREHLHPEAREAVWNSLQRVLSTGESRWEAEYRFQQQDGSYLLIADKATVLRDNSGNAIRVIGGMSDVTAHRQAEERLAYDALHDSLTGLPNRQFFREQLEQALRKTGESRRTAVLFLDLDRFKVVNDSLGHPAGDRVLRALSKRIEMALHPGELAARFGGDEFTVLLEKVQDLAEAKGAAERILKSLSFPYEFEGHSLVISASIGIALAEGAMYPEEVLRYADIAMYRAKERGRARHEVFESAVDMKSMNILQLESELRRGVAVGDFRLYYQPIVSLSTGRISGFEALLRWQHPRRGVLPPFRVPGPCRTVRDH